MMEECSRCGADILTEAQIYTVIPSSKGIKLICTCLLDRYEILLKHKREKIDRLEEDLLYSLMVNDKLEEELESKE